MYIFPFVPVPAGGKVIQLSLASLSFKTFRSGTNARQMLGEKFTVVA